MSLGVYDQLVFDCVQRMAFYFYGNGHKIGWFAKKWLSFLFEFSGHFLAMNSDSCYLSQILSSHENTFLQGILFRYAIYRMANSFSGFHVFLPGWRLWDYFDHHEGFFHSQSLSCLYWFRLCSWHLLGYSSRIESSYSTFGWLALPAVM